MNSDDRLAILEAIQRYSHAIDGRDAGAYAALFAQDGVFEVTSTTRPQPFIRAEGRDGIREWVTATTQRWGAAQTRHHQCCTVFEALTPDAAQTRTLLLESRLLPGERTPMLYSQGVYTDDWVRGAEGWLIARRALRLDLAGDVAGDAAAERPGAGG